MNLLEQLEELFKGHEAAFNFLKVFLRYVHSIDDSIDEEFNADEFCLSHYLASLVFTSTYFLQHIVELGSCWHTLLNIYNTTVKWERSDEEKKKQAADILRHCGIEMILKVVLIEFDWEKQREIDELLRFKVINS